MDINKVNEIVADMKEEERKKQEAIEAEVAKFLEGRLEYYVAMVLNGDVKNRYSMSEHLERDGCKYEFNTCKRIEKALKEYDIYMCYHGSSECIERSYMDIKKVNPTLSQDNEVENRQIELGLRKEDIGLEDEIDLYFTIEQPETSLIAWIALYMIIIIAIILFFIFK